MENPRRLILIAASILTFIFLIIYMIGRWNANDIDKILREGRPLGIRIALVDQVGENALDMLLQAVIFPDQKQVCFYFVNRDAYYDGESDAISSMSPSSADRFYRFTGVRSDYYMTLSRAGAVRLLNLLRGMDLFIEEPLVVEDADFQYTGGFKFFPGEQIIEYMTGDVKAKSDDPLFISLDRLLRQESALVSMFWNRKSYRERLADPQLRTIAYELFTELGFNTSELLSLMDFLTGDVYANILEVPLEAKSEGGRTSRKRFVVKEDSAKKLFDKFKDDLTSGRFRKKDRFTVEVLNGTDKKGLARKVKRFLESVEQGPKVLDAQNFDPGLLQTSVILDRNGNTYFAELLAKKTGLKRERIYFRRLASVQAKLSLILGVDFSIKQLKF